MTARPGIALLLGPMAFSACTFGSQACTLAGSRSTVDSLGLGSVEITELCVDDACRSRNPGDPLEIAVPISDEPADHAYRLTFINDDGQARTVEGTVKTEEFRANGPGCEPVTANATLTVDDNGDVEVSHP